jgi:SAM-dependent methyltransferase
LTHVRFERTSSDWYGEYVALVERLIARFRPRLVCELGAGANPALSLEFIEKQGIEFAAIDVSPEELAKAPDGYRKLELDLAAEDFEPPGTFDFAFSVALAEHLAKPQTFHRNVLRLLTPEGRVAHHFSTLYGLPFVANRILPEPFSDAVLRRLFPDRERGGSHEKFKAVYKWCRGPSRRQIRRFEQMGYDVEEYVGFFGHRYYRRYRRLQRLEDRVADFLLEHPVVSFTTYSYVLLKPKPPGTSAAQ